MRNLLILVGLLVVFEVDKKGKIKIMHTQLETSKASCEKENVWGSCDGDTSCIRRRGWEEEDFEDNIVFDRSGIDFGFKCLDISFEGVKTESNPIME
jgi:hypothetical protein